MSSLTRGIVRVSAEAGLLALELCGDAQTVERVGPPRGGNHGATRDGGQHVVDRGHQLGGVGHEPEVEQPVGNSGFVEHLAADRGESLIDRLHELVGHIPLNSTWVERIPPTLVTRVTDYSNFGPMPNGPIGSSGDGTLGLRPQMGASTGRAGGVTTLRGRGPL